MKFTTSILVSATLALAAQAHAATVVPNTFNSGQAASASAVNANFAALATAIDGVIARVEKLEGSQKITAFDIAGTYNMMVVNSGVGTSYVSQEQTTATVVLSPGNNVAFTCETHVQEEVAPNAMYGRPDTNGAIDGRPFLTTTNSSCAGVLSAPTTWSYDMGVRKVTFAGTNVELMPMGPGLLIGRAYNIATNGSNPVHTNLGSSLLILVRKQ